MPRAGRGSPRLQKVPLGSQLVGEIYSEADELDLGSPVLDIRRTTRDRGGRAVVHVHIVVSADRVSLAYRQLL